MNKPWVESRNIGWNDDVWGCSSPEDVERHVLVNTAGNVEVVVVVETFEFLPDRVTTTTTVDGFVVSSAVTACYGRD